MKKLLYVMLTTLLLSLAIQTGSFGIIANAATSGTTGDCTWSLDGTVLTISGNGAMGDYYGYNVAPWGNSITTVTINNGVTSIGEYAFSGCSGLTSVTIPNSVTSISNYAFYNCCGLIRITIPDSVTSIGNYAFYNCSGLIRITIPDSVTSIGNYAFYNCSGLISITIPDSVTSIGFYAFFNCSSLTSITIPSSVPCIDSYAFYNCSSLTSITIPDSVTSIDRYAFYNCSSLTSITIPNSVTSIGVSAFSGCSGLTSITLPFIGDKRHLPTDTWQWPFGYIFGGINYTGGTAIEQYYYERSTSSATNSTFYIPSNLKTVIITDSAYIPYGAFSGCSGLTSITIPDNLGKIGDYAFYDCSNIVNAEIKGTVSIIGENTFFNCSKLENILLSKEILLIKKYAFDGCGNLKNVYYEGSEEEWSEVAILQYNDILNSAALHFNSTEIPPQILSIEIEQIPDKIKYYEQNATLDVTGGKIKVIYDDNTSKIIDISASMVSGFDNTVLGKQTLTVTYGGKTVTYEIEILDESLMHNFEDGICSICGCKQVSVINAKPATPAFLHNGEYIYDVYSITDSHAANIQLELICGNEFDNTNTYFYIYDLAYNEVGVLTLEQAKTKTITVNGTTAIIRMVSNKADLSYSVNVLINYVFEIGDIDGDFETNAEDLTLLKKVLLSAIEMKQYQMKNADVNKDGQVDIRDLIHLKKALVDNTVPTDETDKTQENSIQLQEAYLDQKNILS